MVYNCMGYWEIGFRDCKGHGGVMEVYGVLWCVGSRGYVGSGGGRLVRSKVV